MKDISWWWTDFSGDEAYRLTNAINQGHISQGSVAMEFEQRVAELLNVPYVVATTNGSTALLMALIAAGVGPDDEVIVPNRSWIATAHAPLILGARVALVDVESDSTRINPETIEKKITPRTKVILPVHLNGRSAGMDAINGLGRKYDLTVIEDAAQAFYSRNSTGYLGTQSFAGCFSMALGKLISTGQGGFVVTNDESTYKTLKAMRSHGLTDVIDVTYNTRPGFNFKFTDIHASIGLAQLDKLPASIARVNKIHEKYLNATQDLSFLTLLPVDVEAGGIPIYNEVLCPQREKLIQYLERKNIQARPFAPDLNTAEYFGNTKRFPNSEIFGNQGICLPCGPGQPLENIDRVIDALRSFGRQI